MVIYSNNKIFGLRFIQEVDDYEYGETTLNIVYEKTYEDEMNNDKITEAKRIYDCIENKTYYRFYYYAECTTTANMDFGNDGYFMCWMPIADKDLLKLFEKIEL